MVDEKYVQYSFLIVLCLEKKCINIYDIANVEHP